QYFTSLKLVTGMLRNPYLLADGKIKVYASSIAAYQSDEHYAVSQKTFACITRTYLAVETLPGFAVRLAKGKLNVYGRKYYNGNGISDEYFLQTDNGPIIKYTPETLKDLVKDNPEAMDFFTSKKNK